MTCYLLALNGHLNPKNTVFGIAVPAMRQACSLPQHLLLANLRHSGRSQHKLQPMSRQNENTNAINKAGTMEISMDCVFLSYILAISWRSQP
jgi:hypothetical protein